MKNHTHIQYISVFTWKPKAGENHWMIFLICLEELHSLEAPTSFVFQFQLEGGSNPLVSQATAWGKLQLPNSMATTRRRLQTPKFSGYNWKVATTTYPYLIQPPWNINAKCRQIVIVTESTTVTVNLYQ